MKITKILTMSSIALISLITLVACGESSKTQTATSNLIKNADASKKYPLVFDDNETTVDTSDAISYEVIQYLDGNEVKTIKINFDSDGAVNEDSPNYKTTILTNQKDEAYVKFEKDSSGGKLVHVYRQPYVVYAQQPVKGEVTAKETK